MNKILRVPAVLCAEEGDNGGGNGEGGGLPGNPQVGDTYVVNLPNGVSRLLEYHCYDYACFWETILTTLPQVVVSANRQDYYFLPLNPFPNMFILGPDNLLYNYNANWMQWTGVLDVENKVTTPCLRNQVEAIRSNDVASDIQEIFNDVFDNNAGNNMYTFTESSNPAYPARTFLESTNPLQLRTDLNTSLLSTASLEYTTIVVYHEIVHAILYNNGMEATLHHPTILADYIDQLAQSAISLFPNLPIQDARAIALFGLGGVANSNPTVYDQVAGQYGLTREQISEKGTSYRRDNVQGNIKKGTPCN